MYDPKVLDHYNNPRNVGGFSKKEDGVGTGIVGAPACGDVMKLQVKIVEEWRCEKCGKMFDSEQNVCCENSKIVRVSIITDAKFKTFGCGSAIASSSLATEMIKGKTLEEAYEIKNSAIVEELKLPPVKIHCSVLAEDAIKAAIDDYKRKKNQK